MDEIYIEEFKLHDIVTWLDISNGWLIGVFIKRAENPDNAWLQITEDCKVACAPIEELYNVGELFNDG